MKTGHFVGGVLLVSGTTIGAGMLALPVVSAFAGLFPSILGFFCCWAAMLATALFFLDITLEVKGDPNLISMAHQTLGAWGKSISWVVYLLLLYSLTAAYIAASSPLFASATAYIINYRMPEWIFPFILSALFGGGVYLGTAGIDVINRVMMIGLGISFLLLTALLPEHVEKHLWTHTDWLPSLIILPMGITSFGYHIIIPSLTTYMNQDRKGLRWVLIIGSLLPLLFYALWQVLVLGIVPIRGEASLAQAWCQGISVTQPLTQLVKNEWVKTGAHLFSFFAIVTSFLGVTLSLSDFLIDGFKIKKTWEGRLLACLLTFVPPLIFVFYYQRGFLVALEYGGIFVSILLIFMPAMMAWRLRTPRFYSTLWGRMLILLVIAFALFIIVIELFEKWGYFNPALSPYLQNHV